jgi:hypothetical protein
MPVITDFIFNLNIPVNISMLDELADQLVIALGYAFPTCMASRSVGKNAFSTKRMNCQRTLYISAVAHRFTSQDYCISSDSLEITKTLATDVNPVVKNGLMLLQKLAELENTIPAGSWMAWVDERGYLYFQPSAVALSRWLELLYWRSLSWSSIAVVDRWPLALADRLAPSAMCWWYMGDRCEKYGRESMAVAAVKAAIEELVVKEDPEVQRLLRALMDLYDLLESNALTTHRGLAAIGRQLTESFLDWERGWPGREVLSPILRVAALELLEQSSGRW